MGRRRRAPQACADFPDGRRALQCRRRWQATTALGGVRRQARGRREELHANSRAVALASARGSRQVSRSRGRGALVAASFPCPPRALFRGASLVGIRRSRSFYAEIDGRGRRLPPASGPLTMVGVRAMDRSIFPSLVSRSDAARSRWQTTPRYPRCNTRAPVPDHANRWVH